MVYETRVITCRVLDGADMRTKMRARVQFLASGKTIRMCCLGDVRVRREGHEEDEEDQHEIHLRSDTGEHDHVPNAAGVGNSGISPGYCLALAELTCYSL